MLLFAVVPNFAHNGLPLAMVGLLGDLLELSHGFVVSI